MYVETQKNTEYLFVAKDIARNVAAGATIDNYTDLSDGEVAWITPQNIVVDTGATQDCADYTMTLFSDLTRKVTMQNLFHDGGFSNTGVSEKVIDRFKS